MGVDLGLEEVGLNRSGVIGDLAAALALAQGAFEPISKSRVNPRFGHAYATLDDIISATRKALSANGLAIMQLTPRDGAERYVETLLVHSSGQWLSTRLSVMVGNITTQEGKQVLTPAQAFGSALTYARRYALAALLNVAADEDDDAETAGEKGRMAIPKRQQPDAPKETAKPLPALTEEAPETPDAGEETAQASTEAPTASESRLATPYQVSQILGLGKKWGALRPALEKKAGKKLEALTTQEAGDLIDRMQKAPGSV